MDFLQTLERCQKVVPGPLALRALAKVCHIYSQSQRNRGNYLNFVQYMKCACVCGKVP